MRVLHVTTYLSYGAGKAAIRLHDALLDKGIDSHILYLYLDSTPVRNSHLMPRSNYFTKFFRKLGIISSKEKKNMSYLEGQEKRYEAFTFCESDFDITSHPEYKKADIINLHWIGFFLDYPSFFAKNTKPIVWSLSDMNAFTGGCHYSKACEKFISEKCTNCPQLIATSKPNQSSINLIKKQNSFLKFRSLINVVTPANWLNELSKSSMLFKGYAHEIIPHASDETIYKLLDKDQCIEALNLPKDKIILLFSSGSLKSVRKGFSSLHQAINILKDPRIHLLIIGNLDIDLHLDGSVYTVKGYINDEHKLNVAYNAASAIVVPSEEDNLPLTVIDSMMSGIPSITYNIGGMRDHVIDGVNGIKAKEFSAISLSHAISDFVTDKYSFSKDQIRSIALLKYSKPKHAEEYIGLYNKVLK